MREPWGKNAAAGDQRENAADGLGAKTPEGYEGGSRPQHGRWRPKAAQAALKPQGASRQKSPVPKGGTPLSLAPGRRGGGEA